MSTSFEHDMHQDPEQLEREVNAKREHINDLVNALEQRLSPGQLIDQVLAYTKGNGSEFAHNLGTTLKNNPVPTTLTVLGLVWLGFNQNRPFSPGPSHQGVDLKDSVGGAVASVKGAFAHAGDALLDVGHSIRSKSNDLQNRAGELGQGARESVEHSADRIRASAQHLSDQTSVLRGQVDHFLKEQPLVVAALGIAFGAALGAALPSTRKEDELMGTSSDRLTGTLKAKGEQAMDAVKETVREATAKEVPDASLDGERPTI